MSDGAVRIRVLCVDDHPIVLKGVAGLVDIQSDMEVVAKRRPAARRSSSFAPIDRTSR